MYRLLQIKFRLCQLFNLYKTFDTDRKFYRIQFSMGDYTAFGYPQIGWQYHEYVGEGLFKNWWYTDKVFQTVENQID